MIAIITSNLSDYSGSKVLNIKIVPKQMKTFLEPTK